MREARKVSEQRKEEVLRQLRELGREAYEAIEGGRFPEITLPSRSVKNIVYDEALRQFILGASSVKRSSHNVKHIRPYTQLLWLAFFSQQLVREKKTSTLRDVYYSAQAYNTEFADQDESDETITDLETALMKAREDFNIYPEERSSIFGNLTVEYTIPGYEGRRLDLTSHPDGVMIGPALTTAEFADTDAEMVIAIEKGGLFTRFIEENVHKKHKAILINTAGQPPRSTRYIIRRLNQELHLPVYVLADSDPWGTHIAMVIISGSANAAHLRELTTPDAKWIGVWASIPGDETVVIERDGLIRNERIETAYSQYASDIRMNSSNGKSPFTRALCCDKEGRMGVMPVAAMTKHRYRDHIFEVKSAGGYRVKATGNHSIQIFNPDTFSLESKPTNSIVPGDLVAACFSVPDYQRLKELNLAEIISAEAPEEAEKIFVEGTQAAEFCSYLRSKYTKRVLRRRFYQVLKRDAPKLSYFMQEGKVPTDGSLRLRYSRNRVPIRIKATKELGRLLGYHAAEGSLPRTERGRSCDLAFGGSEIEYAQDAAECIEKVFGIRATLRRRTNRLDVRYGGSLLAMVFLKLFSTGDHAENKKVPYLFFNVPDEVKVEFIRGCFRGDRTVSYNRATRLGLKTVSRKLASDLTVLLRQLECVAYVYRQGNAWVVSCANTSRIDDVVTEICRKPVHTNSAIQSIPGQVLYPVRGEMSKLLPYGKRTQLHQLIFTGNGKSRVGYKKLMRAFQMLEKPVTDQKLRTIMRLVRNQVVLLPVKEVKDLGPTDDFVYDIEVEGVHTFVGGVGGLVLHNSDINKYKLPHDKLNELDVKRLYELQKDPRYEEKLWRDEIDCFLKYRKKAELEAFARYGLTYIVDKYLPDKLEWAKSH